VRWHHTQATQYLDDGSFLFEADVDGLFEITSWILGYGEAVEVLAPTVLREKAEAVVRWASRQDDARS
jgi:predicted DNA-binding transcriptional regulator YafY